MSSFERILRSPWAPPVAFGLLLASLDVPVIPGICAIVTFVVTLEAILEAARGER